MQSIIIYSHKWQGDFIMDAYKKPSICNSIKARLIAQGFNEKKDGYFYIEDKDINLKNNCVLFGFSNDKFRYNNLNVPLADVNYFIRAEKRKAEQEGKEITFVDCVNKIDFLAIKEKIKKQIEKSVGEFLDGKKHPLNLTPNITDMQRMTLFELENAVDFWTSDKEIMQVIYEDRQECILPYLGRTASPSYTIGQYIKTMRNDILPDLQSVFIQRDNYIHDYSILY